MKELADLVEQMMAAGLIADYAVFGAVAQMCYTEAVVTEDADILIGLDDAGAGLVSLGPLYAFCAARGYRSEGEAIRVGEWPVQFIPAFDDVTVAAMRNAVSRDVGGAAFRVVTAAYLVLIALSVGRPKDNSRILALLEAGCVDAAAIDALVAQHELVGQWQRFRRRFVDEE